MKIIPYQTKKITSPLSNEGVLNKISEIIDNHRGINFNTVGFIGGEVKDGRFQIYMTTEPWRKPFPVKAYGFVDENGKWTITYTSDPFNIVGFIMSFGLMTFLTIKYGTACFMPLMLIYVGLGIYFFNKDVRALDVFLKKEVLEI
jgi:hypothetical protein